MCVCVCVNLLEVIKDCVWFVSAESLGMENAAKERLRNKLSLYDKGLIHTQELFSEINLQ